VFGCVFVAVEEKVEEEGELVDFGGGGGHDCLVETA
jgi:hypothetical protein